MFRVKGGWTNFVEVKLFWKMRRNLWTIKSYEQISWSHDGEGECSSIHKTSFINFVIHIWFISSLSWACLLQLPNAWSVSTIEFVVMKFILNNSIKSVLISTLKLIRLEKPHLKLPKNIEEAKRLGIVLSHYKDKYFVTVLSGFLVTYVL